MLRSCLVSILRFKIAVLFEIIVVDNNSSDGSAAMVAAEFPSVKLVASKVNTGYAKGNNLAFAEATGDLLLTLNPDTEFDNESLSLAVQILTSTDSFGVLGIKQIGMDGKTQRSVRGFPTLLGIFGEVTGLAKSLPNSVFGAYRLHAFDYEKEQPGPQPMGTFLLFKRAAMEAIGDPSCPFDEDFPIFFNEVDLLKRLADAGYPCLYTPKAHVLHHGGESTKLVKKSMIWESHRSLVRYLHKHNRNGLSKVGILLVTPLIYLVAMVRAKGYDAGFRA